MASLKRATTLLSNFRRQSTITKSLPQLTKDRYPHIKRGDYATLSQKHLDYFVGLLGRNRVLTDPSDCEMYNVDFIKAVRGYSQCVLKPQTTEEVSNILSFCNQHRLAVCPQGGNTGLVGGSVPVFDEVVLSTSLLNKIISIDDISGVMVCEAGCVLERLDETLGERGLMMPLDLGAKGSCNIGGNVSTNAGGLRLLRYGNLHGSVLGVEAVKANGDVIDCLSTLKKDNTGYHLMHLFIGSEGTLGIVTKVAIHCPSRPTSLNLALLGLHSFEDILRTYSRAKKELSEILSSCEMMDASSLDVVTSHLKLKSPLGEFPFYMVIETSGSNEKHDEEKLNAFLESVMGDGIVADGTVTNEPSKIRLIWDLRERITEGLLHDGYLFKYDISLPIKDFYSLIPKMRERLGSDASRIAGYGHIGDGNIHLNISVPEFRPDVLKKVEPYVYELTSKLKGSVSAEHGVGFRKPPYIHYSKSDNAIGLMKELKNMMDPNGILNPYKVLPSQ
ncbi:D-2-hydroxyglutarate dehydrogenase, mitochondrial-like isoform X2 [Photinus pyralis]|nr:D-2-hydroxyglutarate dehydrogenase, mitochondrial-like isoform X2 [Photinus pyralis]